jgi:predicted nuclease of predicted toxin-antitoxin system
VARLYANENFPRAVVEGLRSLGHDVLTTREAGRDNQRIADEDVLAFAITERRILLTINRYDFIRLHRGQSLHYGIIVRTEDADSTRQAIRINAAIIAVESLDGQLVRVNRPAQQGL